MGCKHSKKEKTRQTRGITVVGGVNNEAKAPTAPVKLLLLGEIGVGKTSLIVRFVDGEFVEETPTIGMDAKEREVDLNEVKVKARIWDTGGQERFSTITASFYRGADVVIVVFDLTNEDTFDKLHYWIDQVRKFGRESTQLLICGHKLDLSAERIISEDDAKEKADSLGYSYVEASAKEDKNVELVFKTAIYEVLQQREQTENFYDSQAQGY
mmetsp:Transcript_17172/g.19145  ORF Transcript_17172/g.19145 Transcript_17172/m.19145 type:complete len:212 (-) Transcript_17172:140-775(-)